MKVAATNILAPEKEVAVADTFPGETLYIGDTRRFTPHGRCTDLRVQLPSGLGAVVRSTGQN
jgi:hypothetical protein